MFYESVPLEDEPDKNINGYDTKESTSDLLDELEKLLNEYKEELKNLDDKINETQEFIDNSLEDINSNVNLQGDGKVSIADKAVERPYKDDPIIVYTLYDTIKHYQQKKKEIDKRIKELTKLSTGLYTNFKNFENKVNDFESILKYRKLSDLESESYQSYKNLVSYLETESQQKYNQVKNFESFGQTGYTNIIEKLIDKYNKLKRNVINIDKPYTNQIEVSDKIADVLDMLEIVDKTKLNEISTAGNDARELYYQLIQTKKQPEKGKNEEHYAISNSNPTRREDGTRNEVLFKKYILPRKFENKPLIDFRQSTFYDPIDFETKNRLIELKTNIQLEEKIEDNWLYIGKDKVDELIKKGKDATKTPTVYWYLNKETGALAKLNSTEFNKISKDDYFGRLYKLVNDLDDKTFTKKDLAPKSKNVYKPTYRIKLNDDRIAQLISKPTP
jgi:hypothetical protein